MKTLIIPKQKDGMQDFPDKNKGSGHFCIYADCESKKVICKKCMYHDSNRRHFKRFNTQFKLWKIVYEIFGFSIIRDNG